MGFLSTLRRDLKGGTKAYKEFNDRRNKWVESQLRASGIEIPEVTTIDHGEGDRQQSIALTASQRARLAAVPGGAGWEQGDNGYVVNPEYQKLQRQFEQEQWAKIGVAEQKAAELRAQWLDTLDPATRQKALDEFKLHSSDMDSINKYGSVATKALLGTIAGGAALAAGGVIGGGATAAPGLSGVDAAMADLAASGGLTGSSFGTAGAAGALPAFDTGVGGLFGSQTAIDTALASGGAGGLVSTAGAGGGALIGSGGIAAPSLAGAGGASAGGGILDVLKQTGTTFDWGNALLTGAGLTSAVAAMLSDPDSIGKGDPNLLAAQLRSLGYQETAVNQIMEIATQQRDANGRLLPLQEEALRFALDAGRTAYAQSQEDRAYAVERRGQLTGLQDKMIADAEQFDTPAEEARRANAAMAGVGKSYADVNAANDRELAAMGVMPGSGRQMALREANASNQSRLAVSAANDARLAARNEGRSLVDRAAGALAGYPAAATGATALGANLGAGQVNTANAGAAGINSGFSAQTGAQQAAAGVAGQLGSNATGMYGVQTSRDLASTAAKNAANENLWAGAGTLLGGLSKWYQTAKP